jgi:tyrosyl-tRNA synthetase
MRRLGTTAPRRLHRAAAAAAASAAARAGLLPPPRSAVAAATVSSVPTRPGAMPSGRRMVAAAASADATQQQQAQQFPPAPPPLARLPPGTNIVSLLRSRGLLADVAGDGLEAAAGAGPLPVYCGFDPTAPSLHLGNLLGIVVLTWFRAAGHPPIALLGGATGRVGDPSGRSAERPVLSEAALDANVAGIRAILEDLLTRPGVADGGPAPTILNNHDWFGQVGLLDFLRDVGKFARVGTMLSRDSVKSRMAADAEGLSFTEFTYQLLQGYDFVHLARSPHAVRLQVGGSDQMGNVVAGLDLLRRLGGVDGSGNGASSDSDEASTPSSSTGCYGLTFPLLTKSDGTKMGKSADGAVWLAASQLSPFKFYQYLLTTVPDADVIKFLRMLTFLPLDYIEGVEAAMAAGPGGGYAPGEAQRILASEVTRFVHGEAGLASALAATAALRPGADTALDADALEAAVGDGPSASLARADVVGRPLAELMAAVGLQPSKAAVRRMIAGGGVALNNAKVGDEGRVVEEGDLIGGRLLLLAAGKKNKLLVRVEG